MSNVSTKSSSAYKSIKKYWDDRYQKQGVRAVGFKNSKGEQWEKDYEVKHKFIAPFFPKKGTIVEFGCGTGIWAKNFDADRYTGVDISENFLEAARSNNPEHTFIQDDGKREYEADTAIFINVLQHNDETTARDIVQRVKAKQYIIYENCHDGKSREFMNFRSPLWYKELVEDVHDITSATIHSHTVHGEKHGLCLLS